MHFKSPNIFACFYHLRMYPTIKYCSDKSINITWSFDGGLVLTLEKTLDLTRPISLLSHIMIISIDSPAQLFPLWSTSGRGGEKTMGMQRHSSMPCCLTGTWAGSNVPSSFTFAGGSPWGNHRAGSEILGEWQTFINTLLPASSHVLITNPAFGWFAGSDTALPYKSRAISSHNMTMELSENKSSKHTCSKIRRSAFESTPTGLPDMSQQVLHAIYLHQCTATTSLYLQK